MTSLAQVHGLTGDTSIEERARFDNRYIEDWTLLGDLRVLGPTVAMLAEQTNPGRRGSVPRRRRRRPNGAEPSDEQAGGSHLHLSRHPRPVIGPRQLGPGWIPDQPEHRRAASNPSRRVRVTDPGGDFASSRSPSPVLALYEQAGADARTAADVCAPFSQHPQTTRGVFLWSGTSSARLSARNGPDAWARLHAVQRSHREVTLQEQ
jgi:hypothetical protein